MTPAERAFPDGFVRGTATAAHQADSAQHALHEVLAPQGWVLLNFLMDSRTRLGRFRDFRISNYQLMMQPIDACQRYTIDEILELPNVKEPRRPVPPADRGVRGPAAALQHRPRERGRRRPAPRGGHPRREPLHGLRVARAVAVVDGRQPWWLFRPLGT
jgi:hypothetical protein